MPRPFRQTRRAHAKEAEKEASTTAHERDTVAERTRAAHERTMAAEGDPDAPRNDDPTKEDDEPPSADHGGTLHHAIPAHEAAAIVNPHTQAISVQNIRSLVHTVLHLNASNYPRWRDQIILVIGKYSPECHILANRPAPEFSDGTRMDCVVKS